MHDAELLLWRAYMHVSLYVYIHACRVAREEEAAHLAEQKRREREAAKSKLRRERDNKAARVRAAKEVSTCMVA